MLNAHIFLIFMDYLIGGSKTKLNTPINPYRALKEKTCKIL